MKSAHVQILGVHFKAILYSLVLFPLKKQKFTRDKVKSIVYIFSSCLLYTLVCGSLKVLQHLG